MTFFKRIRQKAQRILLRILRILLLEEPRRIALEGYARWKVRPVREARLFLRALCCLVPPDSVLYLEDGSPPPGVRLYLEERAARETCEVQLGTFCFWGRPSQFHMAATRENLLGLAQLAQHCAEPEIAIHLHVYARGKILLEWHDAFCSRSPIYISHEVPEHHVQAFCKELGVTYEQEVGGP